MNLIQQHMDNVAREEAQLEERQVQLKAEQDETRKLLNNIKRYRKSLCKQYPSSQATLSLAPPDEEEEEEEATDEPVDLAKAIEDTDDSEPLVPGEQSSGYEVPEEPVEVEDMAANWHPSDPRGEHELELEPAPAEPEKPIRRRKAKATADEVANG